MRYIIAFDIISKRTVYNPLFIVFDIHHNVASEWHYIRDIKPSDVHFVVNADISNKEDVSSRLCHLHNIMPDEVMIFESDTLDFTFQDLFPEYFI